jgi:hypothetical protein
MFGVVPTDPKITIERDGEGKAIRYCIDAKTEQTLQRQRHLAMAASGVLIYAAWKMKARWWLRLSVAGVGIMMFTTHVKSRQAISRAERL